MKSDTGTMQAQTEQNHRENADDTPVSAYNRAYLNYLSRKYPNVPEHAKPRITPINDSSANGITTAICNYVNWSGGIASRINNTGQYDEKSGTWRIGTGRKGISDIAITVGGKSIWVEVKYGKDKLSDAQEKFRDDITRVGGYYFEAKSFASFWHWYQQFEQKPEPVRNTGDYHIV